MLVEVRSTPPRDWARLVAADPAADYFHTAVWTTLVAEHLAGATPLWLAVRDGGELVGGLAAIRHGGRVRRVHSSVFGCAGGPLVAASLPPDLAVEIGEFLVRALLDQRGRGLTGAAIALNPDHEARWGSRLANDPRFLRKDSPAAVVSLEGGTDAVAARMRKSKRNERNRGLRRGLQIDVTTSREDLEAYHRLHERAARAWGQPVLPWPLLVDLVERGGGEEGGSAFFVAVRHEGRLVGGHLNFHLGATVTAWHGVTEPALARSHFPATVAVWGDIVEACRRGAGRLDLGGSGGLASLESFKRGFGARTRARGWYVADSGRLRFLRRLRDWWRRAAGRRRSRWHDGATGSPRGGAS